LNVKTTAPVVPASFVSVDRNARLTLVQNENIYRTDLRDIMAQAEKIIVMTFKKNRGGIVPGEMRTASNAVAAEKIAAAMAPRHVGVAAYKVMVDDESGDMASPILIASHGEIADLDGD